MGNLNATIIGKILGGHRFGREIYGVYRGDAAAGADIPLFNGETGAEETVGETERVAIFYVNADQSADGESMVYIDNDGDEVEDENEIVWRGHCAGGGGKEVMTLPVRVGSPGAVPRCKGPNVLNVQIGGYIF